MHESCGEKEGKSISKPSTLVKKEKEQKTHTSADYRLALAIAGTRKGGVTIISLNIYVSFIAFWLADEFNGSLDHPKAETIAVPSREFRVNRKVVCLKLWNIKKFPLAGAGTGDAICCNYFHLASSNQLCHERKSNALVLTFMFSLINNQLLTDARTPWINSCAWLLALHVLDEVKKWFFNNSSLSKHVSKEKDEYSQKSMEMWRASNHKRKKKKDSCRHPLTREPWQWMNGWFTTQRIGKREIREKKKVETELLQAEK